jgi:hypothetical protein
MCTGSNTADPPTLVNVLHSILYFRMRKADIYPSPACGAFPAADPARTPTHKRTPPRCTSGGTNIQSLQPLLASGVNQWLYTSSARRRGDKRRPRHSTAAQPPNNNLQLRREGHANIGLPYTAGRPQTQVSTPSPRLPASGCSGLATLPASDANNLLCYHTTRALPPPPAAPSGSASRPSALLAASGLVSPLCHPWQLSCPSARCRVSPLWLPCTRFVTRQWRPKSTSCPAQKQNDVRILLCRYRPPPADIDTSRFRSPARLVTLPAHPIRLRATSACPLPRPPPRV